MRLSIREQAGQHRTRFGEARPGPTCESHRSAAAGGCCRRRPACERRRACQPESAAPLRLPIGGQLRLPARRAPWPALRPSRARSPRPAAVSSAASDSSDREQPGDFLAADFVGRGSAPVRPAVARPASVERHARVRGQRRKHVARPVGQRAEHRQPNPRIGRIAAAGSRPTHRSRRIAHTRPAKTPIDNAPACPGRRPARAASRAARDESSASVSAKRTACSRTRGLSSASRANSTSGDKRVQPGQRVQGVHAPLRQLGLGRQLFQRPDGRAVLPLEQQPRRRVAVPAVACFPVRATSCGGRRRAQARQRRLAEIRRARRDRSARGRGRWSDRDAS